MLGRTIDCPECGRPLRLVREGPGTMRGEVIAPGHERPSVSRRRLQLPDVRHLLTPTAIAWIVASLMTAILMGLLIWPRIERPPATPDETATVDVVDESPALAERETGSPAGVVDAEVVQPPQAAAVEIQPASPSVEPSANLPDGPVTPAPTPEAPISVNPQGEDVEPTLPPATSTGSMRDIIDAAANPEDLPIAVPISTDEPPIDVAAVLRQPIARFEQTQPVPFRDLLRLLEEMAGVPISTAALDSATVSRFDTPVTLSQSETTVGDLLGALVATVGLRYEIHEQGVRLLDPAQSQEREAAAGAADRGTTVSPE